MSNNDDAPPAGEHNSKDFWSNFVAQAEAPSTGVHSRGLFGSHKELNLLVDMPRGPLSG